MIPDRYVPKKVSDISESDRRVAIVGTLETITEEGAAAQTVLGDGTGRIELFFDGAESPAVAEAVRNENGRLVRAFCTNDAGRLRLDVLQPMAGADINLLKTVEELYDKAGL